ncbi:expressed unknown protein [Seminavis robusta]|uniref:Uncharacterized protein n=1 Tax=Seminavis robusta TaxID=568900 RepID=A0A9N8E1P6_9STRA|nr:expressed unknown protein [Seminavis robusta]|eukprot:Sro531_g161340.1 n/a (221) ;mRNA; r:34868-35603
MSSSWEDSSPPSNRPPELEQTLLLHRLVLSCLFFTHYFDEHEHILSPVEYWTNHRGRNSLAKFLDHFVEVIKKRWRRGGKLQTREEVMVPDFAHLFLQLFLDDLNDFTAGSSASLCSILVQREVALDDEAHYAFFILHFRVETFVVGVKNFSIFSQVAILGAILVRELHNLHLGVTEERNIVGCSFQPKRQRNLPLCNQKEQSSENLCRVSVVKIRFGGK